VTDWGDVIVRARGLSSHILSPARCFALCDSRSIGDLSLQLVNLGLVSAPSADSPADEHSLELALRRRAGARLQLLATWAGARRDLLAPIFDDEDRRAIRALVRGAIARVAPQLRTTGLVPTPSLPIRALDELAQAGDVATVASLLLAWHHPFGAVVEAEARRQQPDTLEFEMALVREFAVRARTAADAGDAALRLFVERTIDLENLQSALALSSQASDVPAGRLFVDGGTIVTVGDLAGARGAGGEIDLAARLARRVRGTPLAAMLNHGTRSAEDAALDALADEFRRRARDAPLSLAPVILFALRQRAELHMLLRILWGVSLGVPRATVERMAGVAA
jgi:vacuolar-type H+-ATPase subunit C/Vma6